MATEGLDPAASGVFGHYRLVERVGGGGFALIYRATDVRDCATVALKLLRPEYAHNADFVRRFRQEADLALSLPEHPHIVPALEFGAHGGTFYLAMEYVEGRDLSKLLEKGGRLSPSQVVAIGRQVASALQTAHARRIFHRDIKPENIRLTSAGVARLLDFGIARPVGGRRLTETGEVIGTPEYIAPEVWHGRDADARADIYALGVVLYEALTGRVPFAGNTPAAVMNQHLFAPVPSLAPLRSDLPAGLESIIRKALARDPVMRLQSAAELLAALQTPDQPVASPDGRAAPPPVDRAVSVAPPPPRPAPPVRGSGVPPAYLLRRGGVSFSLKPGRTVIGRDTPSDLVFDDRQLSGQHARIDRRDQEYALFDLGSRNGTYVNGRRVRQAALRDGDQIRLGQTDLVFVQLPAQPSSDRPPAARFAAPIATANFWAAVCHGCVLFVIATPAVPIVSAVVPLGIWLLAGRHSPHLGFHARQAAAYQALVWLALMIVQVADRPLVPLVWLAAIAYATYAALCCAQGRDFRYPVLGPLMGPPR